MTNFATRSLLLAVFLALSNAAAYACINTVGRSTVSEPIYVAELRPEEFLKALTTHQSKAHWTGVLTELKHPGARWSFPAEKQTNTAVAMLHLGMIKQAIRILEKIESTNPGLYYTAANLGTAYELNGENAKALKWIKEGVTRDADAHNGSEWLHVKILEAKLALERDPNWLASNSVIAIHRVPAEQLLSGRPALTDHSGQTRDLKQVQEALIYQLHERLEFIKPPEGVVADLLFDLSRTLALTRGHEHSATIVNLAQTYGPDLTPWTPSDPLLPAIGIPPPMSMTPYWIAGASTFVAILTVGIFVFVRRRMKE